MRTPSVSGLALLVGLVSGCVEDDLDTGLVTQENKCPQGLCGNSPEVARDGLWEQSLLGQPDSQGVSIKRWNSRASLRKGAARYSLSVLDGRITAWNKFGTLSGAALVGSVIELEKSGAAYFDIHITGVRSQGVTFVTGTPAPIEVYKMVWSAPGGMVSTGKPLCNAPLAGTLDEKVHELYGMYGDELVIFEGDRFDPIDKLVKPDADDSWFNFGCAGHTLAKLYVTRNTVHTQERASWETRQAMMKMYTGDYCGTGDSFTLANEPIGWMGGVLPTYPDYVHPTTLDARWSPAGATCLGPEPRMMYSTNPLAPSIFPNVTKQIRDLCPKLPPCENTSVYDVEDGWIVSSNRDVL